MITNPYLKTKGDGFSLKGELRRLLGGPQIVLTLLLIVLPLALSVAGGLDFATKTMYEMKYHQPDKRRAIWALDCALFNPKANVKLCQDKSGNIRTYYWPPLLPANDSLYYGLPFLVALLSFVAIGNPRALTIGSELKKILGYESSSTNANGPHTDPAKAEGIWLVGAASERRWQSDPGYFYQDTRHLKPYCLSPDMLRTNLLIVAPPGSGKTSSIFRPLIEYLRRIGASAIFFDSKGQDFPPEMFDLNFELNDPANSIKINLFSGDSPAQAGERLGEALIPNLSDDKQYYVDVAKDTCAALVSAHYAVYNLFPDLTELLLYLSEPDKIAGLGERVQTLSQSGQLSYLEIERLNAGLMRINSLLTNTKKDTLGSLNTAITPLTTSAASALLVANPARTGGEQVFTIEEMLKVPRLVRLSLPVAENPRIAPIIGRIILTQFNFAVLSPRCNRNLLKIAAVDEAHNFITASIAKGMAQARSNNAGFMLALQTLSQIPDDSVLDTIFASAGNKLVMAGVGDQDAERFSKTYGELEMPYITHSKSQGRNTSTSSNSGSTTSYSAGRSTTGGSSTSGGGNTSGLSRTTSVTANSSSSQQLKLRRLYLPSEIRALPQYHAIIESSDAYGRRHGAMMIDMSQPTLQQLMAKANKRKGKAKPTAKALPPATLAPLPKAAIDVSAGSGNTIVLVGPNNPARVSTSTLEATNPTSGSKADLTQTPFGKLKFNLVLGTTPRPKATAPGAETTNQTASPLLSPAAAGEKPVSGFGVNYPVQPQALPGQPTSSYSYPSYLKDHHDDDEEEWMKTADLEQFENFGISETLPKLGKAISQPPAKGFCPTGRDRAILEFIGSGGLASLSQLKRKFWPQSINQATCRPRLYRLERAGYLKANFNSIPGLQPGEVTFNLTERGALAFFRERERLYFYTALPGKRDCEQQLIAQATRLYLEEQLPQLGKQLTGWKNERELRGQAVQKMQQKLGGRGLVKFGKLGGIADGEALVLEQATGEITSLVIEIDGQYYGRQFQQKIIELAGFGKPGLWVTTSQRRADRVTLAFSELTEAKNSVEVLTLKEL